MSMNGTAMIFDPTYNSSFIQFIATDISGGKIATLEMSTENTIIGNKLQVNNGATFNVVVTFGSTLISNNITAPTTTSTNNIYTNLGLDGGIINIGAIASNINIKCSLNINESVYGTAQNTVINMESNGVTFTNNGSTNVNYIFTIN